MLMPPLGHSSDVVNTELCVNKRPATALSSDAEPELLEEPQALIKLLDNTIRLRGNKFEGITFLAIKCIYTYLSISH